jgi:carbohydrate-binding DOMON domain-containing protein
MKKTPALIAGILILANSCVTTTIWDESYPPEKSATVLFYQITAKSYNGIGVSKWTSVVLPSGEANIGGDIRISHAGVRFLAQDMEFTCFLEGGKEYTVTGAAKNEKWGVSLYEGKALKDDMFLEFIPFKNQPDTFK